MSLQGKHVTDESTQVRCRDGLEEHIDIHRCRRNGAQLRCHHFDRIDEIVVLRTHDTRRTLAPELPNSRGCRV